MAGTKYAYVRTFELPDPLLPGTFMVFRLDGHSFHRFSDKHNFAKPNDVRALQLMDHAARDVMEEYPDIVLGFGESDEFSFLLRKSTALYNRRESKIVSTLTSLFTSSYVFHWPAYFPDNPLQYPPSFDGRIILYPAERHIRDYFAWRQADTHINNLYNTVFWALVQQGKQSTTQAHATLRGTVSKEKHEVLFSQFKINYNQLDERFRKGSVLVREEITEPQPKEKTTTVIPIQDEYVPGPDSREETTEPRPKAEATVAIPIQQDKYNLTHEDREETTEPPPKATETATIPIQQDKLVLTPETSPSESKNKKKKRGNTKPKTQITILHCDIIKDDFWIARPGLLID